MNTKQKEKSGSRRTVSWILFTLFCLVFAFSSFRFFSILLSNKQADKAYLNLREQAQYQSVSQAEEPAEEVQQPEKTEDEKGPEPVQKRSMDFTDLQKKYPNMKGWILAEGTGIDYPLMQAADNDYYLSHLYDGTSNVNGALFIDYRNKGLLQDDNTVVYGHNMNSGAMFHGLNEYKDQSFYDTYPSILVYTPEGDYRIELIAGTVEDGNYEFVRFNFENFEEMSDYVSEIRSHSTFRSSVELQPGDKLLSMCTCSYELQNARYMLVGRAVKICE